MSFDFIARIIKGIFMAMGGFLALQGGYSILSSKIEHVTDLDQLYRTCDYLIIQIHYNAETKNYIDADAFARMKPGMRLLNFARGELVDTDALLAALESGQVARYVTDFPNAKLVGVKNVVAMPHIGASTPEAEEKCAVMVVSPVVLFTARLVSTMW